MRDWILVVDDDEDVRETMTMILELEGFSSLAAANGKDALDLLSRTHKRPSVIFLDLWMPVMDGRTFLEFRLQDLDLRAIPTYLFSADMQIRKLASDYQATGCLGKPVEIQDMMDLAKKYAKRA